MIRALVLALLLAGCTGEAGMSAERRPTPALPRVVSINPCVDAVLMHLADARQIAGISHYSQDPRATSISLAQAGRFPATSGTAEEVVALAPDMVIAGGHVAPTTITALRRMGIPLLQIGVPESIVESSEQIRAIAVAIGQQTRGEALVQRIETAVRAAKPEDKRAIPALIWQGGGLVPGTGTLANDLLNRTGFRNMSSIYGLKRWDVLPLEPLVARPPRVLLSAGAAAREDRMLSHPVLRSLKKEIAVRSYPDRLLRCGGPTIIDAVGRLADIRKSL